MEYSKHTHNHNTHHMKSLLTRKDICIWLSQQLRGRYRGTHVPQVIRHGSDKLQIGASLQVGVYG